MSDMKCPFCQQELDYLAEDIYGNMYCPNCRDKNGFTYKASESIWQELTRTRKALEFITRISGAGMSYQDMFIDAHEVAKFALGQVKHPVLVGRYDKEMTDLLKGGDNE